LLNAIAKVYMSMPMSEYRCENISQQTNCGVEIWNGQTKTKNLIKKEMQNPRKKDIGPFYEH